MVFHKSDLSSPYHAEDYAEMTFFPKCMHWSLTDGQKNISVCSYFLVLLSWCLMNELDCR